MIINIEIVGFNQYQEFKMIVEDYISLNKLKQRLELKRQSDILVNDFYEVKNYIIQPYDKLSFFVSPMDNSKRIS